MVNEQKSSNRTLIIGLAIGALLLALVAGILIVTLVLGDGSSDAVAEAASAQLMPEDTFSFTTFNPHLDQAMNFEVLERAWGDSALVEKGLSEILTSMKKEGVDYKADIEPWLGDEVAFGMGTQILASMGSGLGTALEGFDALGEGLSTPPDVYSPQDFEFTLAVATKDTTASDSFLDKLRGMAQEEGMALQETTYDGFEVVYSEPDGEKDPGLAYATVDGFVVFTMGGLEPMQAVIDARGDDGSNLADNQDYKDVLAKLPADQIGYGYMDMRAYMDALLDAAGSELAALPAELFDPEQLRAIKGVGYSMGLEPNGLRMDFVAVYDGDAVPDNLLGAEAVSSETVGRVPSDALFYLSGSGLGNVVQMGLEAIQAMPEQPEDLDEQLQMVTSLLGVSLDELIEMLSGEFAVVVGHEPAGIAGDPSVPLGLSFLLEAEDQEKFERLLNSVSTLLTFGSEMEFPKETMNDVEVTMFTDPTSGNMVVGWGVGNGFFAIGTSQKLLEAAFGGGNGTLSDTDLYKSATDLLPKERAGLFFVNVEGLLGIVEEAMSPSERAEFDIYPLFQSIKAISAASEPLVEGKDSASGTLFILVEGE
jgi:hypothetical protein